jgi:hypothetical protein
MAWIATRRIIAAMEDLEAIGDGTVSQFPDHPMRTDGMASGYPELAVPIGVTELGVWPALIGTADIDLFPEPLF